MMQRESSREHLATDLHLGRDLGTSDELDERAQRRLEEDRRVSLLRRQLQDAQREFSASLRRRQEELRVHLQQVAELRKWEKQQQRLRDQEERRVQERIHRRLSADEKHRQRLLAARREEQIKEAEQRACLAAKKLQRERAERQEERRQMKLQLQKQREELARIQEKIVLKVRKTKDLWKSLQVPVPALSDFSPEAKRESSAWGARARETLTADEATKVRDSVRKDKSDQALKSPSKTKAF